MEKKSGFASNEALQLSAGQGRSAFKWKQLGAIEDAMVPLNLKATSINILRAMLSLMSVDRISEAGPVHHVVYASNAKIAQRTHVSVQTVERHLAILVDRKIIQRVAASNGKRWCRRDKQGQVVLISGLSLLPLSNRHAEFMALAEHHQQKQDALVKIRDECLLALSRLKDILHDRVQDLLVRARNTLRRQLKKDVLQDLLEEIKSFMPEDKSAESDAEPIKMSDSNHQNEGHKETLLSLESREREFAEVEFTQHDMEKSFPRLSAEVRFARNHEDAMRKMDDIASQLHLSDAWWKCKDMGPSASFILLGYLLEQSEHVKSHKAYLSKLIAKIESGSLTISSKSLFKGRGHGY